MSNIYLYMTIERNWRYQSFDFVCLKNRLKGSFWGDPTHADITEF